MKCDDHAHWMQSADGVCYVMNGDVYEIVDAQTIQARRQARLQLRSAKRRAIYASTSDGLGEKGKIQNFIIGKISDEASAKAPGSYISHLKSLIKYTDEENYKYINQMYTNYYGSARYSSFSEYTGMNDADYEKDLKNNAVQQASVDLTYENFYVQHGLSVSDETYNLVVSNFGGVGDI